MSFIKKYTLTNMLLDARDAFVKICVSALLLSALLVLLTVVAKLLLTEVIWIWNALPF